MIESRKILVTDLKDKEGDAAKVLEAFNFFLDNQNAIQTVSQKNIVECVVSADVLPVLVKSPVQMPKAVVVCRATVSDGSMAGVDIGIDWRLQNDQICVISVFNMAAGTQYKLWLLVV